MDDELVHVAGLVAEARQAVASLLRGAEFILEERVVLGADDGEVVGHFAVADWGCRFLVSILCWLFFVIFVFV